MPSTLKRLRKNISKPAPPLDPQPCSHQPSSSPLSTSFPSSKLPPQNPKRNPPGTTGPLPGPPPPGPSVVATHPFEPRPCAALLNPDVSSMDPDAAPKSLRAQNPYLHTTPRERLQPRSSSPVRLLMYFSQPPWAPHALLARVSEQPYARLAPPNHDVLPANKGPACRQEQYPWRKNHPLPATHPLTQGSSLPVLWL
ncbi:hypothetical protein NDU88_003669 [Pleurodeles waltl]|uniref:Uncharacterized protein n=1 Tax=Pleurodeles waltl TaxID=8319 RepID=A0AAV7PAP5_PLEWA|nr:hypothetical protein NDU88_003669 [Pleurodeles waltl]